MSQGPPGYRASTSGRDPRARQRIVKIVVLGKYAVGKTCLIRRYADPTFTFNHQYKGTSPFQI